MAQIFVSHSSKDTALVALLSRAFAATKVKGVFEEFEALLKGPANAQRIAQDIRGSNACSFCWAERRGAKAHARLGRL